MLFDWHVLIVVVTSLQVIDAVNSVRAYFVEALHAGIIQADTSSANSAAKMVRVLLDQYSSCQAILLSVLQEKRSSKLQLACLNTIMDFTRAGTHPHLSLHAMPS
jgi:hypothetical protein